MWLINTTTIKLERADDVESTPYAILSHTWGDDEVTFEDMMQGRGKDKKGYTKVVKTCELAKQRGLNYAWLDTCCIDKRSSAELAEAINSMFRWYKFSGVCFAYLEDLEPHHEDGEDKLDGLSDCRWFTRGWTLQELIAPPNLRFFDAMWNHRGSKAKLQGRISDITGIDREVLRNTATLETIPVAKRMSWAANRKTTRIEDLAYCLLGIFDVNMPMLYGEGAKAFDRLQEEIIKGTTDLSIFAWKAHPEREEEDEVHQQFRGILAKSPAEFAHCRHLRRAPTMRYGYEYSMTNKGLKLETYLGYSVDKEYLLNLACMIPNDSGDEQRVGVYLTKTPDGYVRCWPTELFETKDSLLWAGPRHKIFIRKQVTIFGSIKLRETLRLNLACEINTGSELQLASFAAKPADLWDSLRQEFVTDGSEKFTGFLNFQLSNRTKTFITPRIYVVCGLIKSQSSSENVVEWMGVYNSLDVKSSGDIIECIDGYYNSYGEEFYLHQLRDCITRRGDLPREIDIPGIKPHQRHRIYFGSRQQSDNVLCISVHVGEKA
ncbi:beta transducin [Fusarium beomiforme]|uniref:Beta transducin n=1 Tax=Fusarium beomiforme TaxID=44412 RepID=A0A9P5AF01_9HYPO|nr:beta transducin [Fusarium beomiforme]